MKWKGEEELMGKGGKKEGSRKEEREKVEGWNSERISTRSRGRQTSVKGLLLARSARLIKGSHRSELWGSKGLSGKLICKLTRSPYYRND